MTEQQIVPITADISVDFRNSSIILNGHPHRVPARLIELLVELGDGKAKTHNQVISNIAARRHFSAAYKKREKPYKQYTDGSLRENLSLLEGVIGKKRIRRPISGHLLLPDEPSHNK